ncbi:cholinesterase [Talaromyces pinophilus]|uniref:Cholinesterase n=1 Tax=Talaromyces pinophilus TaxID=128442 RepID=A0A478EB49_TALPI|nr:cholinesterase [Talaromyces pinophilus]
MKTASPSTSGQDLNTGMLKTPFSIGNTACPIYNGAILASENGVIVVSADHRLNIFGFPGAPSVDANLGLLDKRLTLEWTSENIKAFGGDPDRIIILGQSADGVSVDMMAYAYPDNPIAHAIISHSGVASSGVGAGARKSAMAMNWNKASSNAGCDNETVDASASMACMRTTTTEEILAAVIPIARSSLASGFGSVVDERRHNKIMLA